IGGKVKVELVDEPANPRKDVLEKVPLEHVISAILYGSYVRKETETGSDIDILLVTDEGAKIPIPPEIMEKYDIQVKSLREFRRAVAHDPVFYKAIKDEAVALINRKILDDMGKGAPPIGKIEQRLELIDSSLGIAEKIMETKHTQAAYLVYPLIMRLRETLILGYLLDDKKYSAAAFRKEVLHGHISSREFSALMSIYRLSRSGRKIPEHKISMDTIRKLVSLLEEKIRYVREKARKKRN
ncbi:MAG: nucleotidyltransferase domain-containing protein, partial [Candidatus Aenigmarchaeota archaeon]|nr:nucleotidyltransferase domain-containing protein [Candidatus Aenigmarchaeota archaeon]